MPERRWTPLVEPEFQQWSRKLFRTAKRHGPPVAGSLRERCHTSLVDFMHAMGDAASAERHAAEALRADNVSPEEYREQWQPHFGKACAAFNRWWAVLDEILPKVDGHTRLQLIAIRDRLSPATVENDPLADVIKRLQPSNPEIGMAIPDVDELVVLGLVAPAERSKKRAAPKRTWTVKEVDAKVSEIFARMESGAFDKLVAGVKAGKKQAKKVARRLFGRNELAKKIGCSGSTVSGSAKWQEIASYLQITDAPRPKKVWLDIAVERAGIDAFETARKNEPLDEDEKLKLEAKILQKTAGSSGAKLAKELEAQASKLVGEID